MKAIIYRKCVRPSRRASPVNVVVLCNAVRRVVRPVVVVRLLSARHSSVLTSGRPSCRRRPPRRRPSLKERAAYEQKYKHKYKVHSFSKVRFIFVAFHAAGGFLTPFNTSLGKWPHCGTKEP